MVRESGEQEVNAIVAALPANESRRFAAQCQVTVLRSGDILCESDQRLQTAYFPTSGIISIATAVDSRPPLELGLIGCDGVLGAHLPLNSLPGPMRAVVSVGGTALAIAVVALQQELQINPRLLEAVHHYQFRLMMQIVQTAACMHFHEIEPRLARWLLMIRDLSQTDTIYFTHSLLADALGVRRSGITLAAGALQKRGLIRYSRGEIRILDPEGLESTACECRGTLIDRYRAMFDSEQNGNNIVAC